jgi:hypothetical protein
VKRPKFNEHNTALDFLVERTQRLRVAESEYVRKALKTTAAVLAYFELLYHYNAHFWSDVLEDIEDGMADAKLAQEFCRKHKVRGPEFLPAIRKAVAFCKQTQAKDQP